ncbi:post-GPI attachment to proteins factor 2-like isoform X2 [Agrilus planipennis]|nr:post-GPI attachment to proteins factor 2-like isoform X2 [Agrilus planipennis]
MNLSHKESNLERVEDNQVKLKTTIEKKDQARKHAEDSALEISDNIIIHYMLNFKDLCLVTLACPLITILTCLITGFIFQWDDIHETHCRVYNIIPSISAITGISPQKYLWRVSIAVHLGPRLLVAAVTRSYNDNLIAKASARNQEEAKKWIDFTFWLQLLEIACLTGVTYISNRENYPAHEKLFITFMVSSILHMWSSIKSTMKIAHIVGNHEVIIEKVRIKKKLLSVSIASIIGIIGFFLQHRFLCHNLAFSWFALCEYIFATTNIIFHFITMMDFPNEFLVIGKGFSKSSLHNPKVA